MYSSFSFQQLPIKETQQAFKGLWWNICDLGFQAVCSWQHAARHCVAQSSKQPWKKGGFERLPPTSEWVLQIPPLKWDYFLTVLLPFCMDPPESSSHINAPTMTKKKEKGKCSVMKYSLIQNQ